MIIAQSIAASTGIRYIDKSTQVYDLGTSQNVTVPSCIDDDKLIAVAMHRSTLTAPVGWTLVATVTASASASPTGTHSLSIYEKDCSGDSGVSTTWSQSVSARICVQILAFRKIGSTCSIIDNDTAHVDETALLSTPTAASTATADGQMGVAFATSALAGSDGVVTAMAVSVTGAAAVVTQDTGANVQKNRLCGGHVRLQNTETTTGTVTTDTGGSGNGWAAVSLVLG